MNKMRISSYKDLDVYQTAYQASLLVIKEIIPKLPKEEQDDLADQLRRSVKAIPRLIAEGHAKRHQKKGFQKYLDDAHAESNETQTGLEQCRGLYSEYIDLDLCEKLIDTYDKISRQLYKLSLSWQNFFEKGIKQTLPQ